MEGALEDQGRRKCTRARRCHITSQACRGEGSAVGPLLAARALPLRCAASITAKFYTGYA
jgi:hypothetical protein